MEEVEDDCMVHLELLYEIEQLDNEITDDYEPTMIMQDEVDDEQVEYDELPVEPLREIDELDLKLILLGLLHITLEDEDDEQEVEQNELDDLDDEAMDEIILETELLERMVFDEVDDRLLMMDDQLYMMDETEAPE